MSSLDRQTTSGAQSQILQALLATIRAATGLLRWLFPALLIIYLLSGITIIGPKETGLRYRFGQLLEGTYPPGMVWAMPLPIESVITVSTAEERELILSGWKDHIRSGDKLTKATTPALHPVTDGYTLTGDANLLRGEFVMRYRIADPVAWQRIGESRETLLSATIYSATTTIMSRQAIDAMMRDREPIRLQIHQLAQNKFDTLKLGVQLTGLELRELGPPGQVRSAFEEVTTAQLSAQTELEEARSYRANLLPQIEAESQIIRQLAETEAKEQIANAKGESSAFLAMLGEYQTSPSLVRTRLLDETLQQILPRVRSSTLLPRDSGNRSTTLLIEPTSISPTSNDE